jgi:DNA-binding response OmpR family regulator
MKRIVLVEDDVTLADMYKLKLELDGNECSVAYDGLRGLALIKEKKPDLVLLDIMLPEMSGAEVLQQVRESDWGKDTKVIMLTNISEAEAPELLFKYKFERYIVKANQTLNQVTDIIRDTLENSSTVAKT